MIQRYRIPVRGVSFDQRQSHLETMMANPGTKIWFERESSNAFDRNAIKVMASINANDVCIGYMPKEHAAVFAPMMDQYGAKLRADHYLVTGGTAGKFFGCSVDLTYITP